MGYTTDFEGMFSIEPVLTLEHKNELEDLAESLGGPNNPPNAPDSYLQWVPTEDGKHLEWDGGEKFYDYTQWLTWLIDDKLKPWGYTVSGSVKWAGEEADDRGILSVVNNVVTATAFSMPDAKDAVLMQFAPQMYSLLLNHEDYHFEDKVKELLSEILEKSNV